MEQRGQWPQGQPRESDQGVGPPRDAHSSLPPGAPPGGPGAQRPPRGRTAASDIRSFAARTGAASVRAGQATRRTVRRATNAHGAGESGMAKLTELSGANAAGDMLVTIALAGSLFFSVSPGEARGRIALYLLITMVPFALLAPLIGPMLDRFRSGRRYALAITFGARAFLVWSMAGSVESAELWLYPAVFGVLVSSRAYGVTRAAGVTRVLPPTMPLVRANSMMNIAGLAAGLAAAAGGIAVNTTLGPAWTLRAAFVVFVAGAVLSVRLPKRIDVVADERPAALDGQPLPGRNPRVAAKYVGPSVEMGLRANMAFRALSGFLTMFLAFLLRKDPIGNLDDTTALALVIGAVGVGSALGSGIGALLRDRGPEPMLVAMVFAETAAILTATVWFSLGTVLAAGFIVGFAQTLGKLGLDAMIQRDVEEDVRSSAFARSETRLQLAWVAGGALGIALPLRGDVGFGIAAGIMIMLSVATLRAAREARAARRRPSAP
ncbi:MAG: MFS transporter [Sporichthyaceae bacterium]